MKFYLRQQKGKREGTKDRNPDDAVAANPVTDDTSEEDTGGGGDKENEQHQLRSRDGNVEAVDEIKRVKGSKTLHVSQFREHQQGEYAETEPYICWRMRSPTVGCFGARTHRSQELRTDSGVLSSDPDHQHHGKDCQGCEPAKGRLSPWYNDESREQWAESAANLTSNLEDSLGEALPIAGCVSGHARCFRVVDGGADADTSDRDEDHDVACREGEAYHSDEGEDHADGRRVRHRILIGVMSDQRLQ